MIQRTALAALILLTAATPRLPAQNGDKSGETQTLRVAAEKIATTTAAIRI